MQSHLNPFEYKSYPISEKTYQNYELMTREPKLDILIKIADCYGVSLDYLTGRAEKREVSK